MRIGKFAVGTIRIDDETYEQDVVWGSQSPSSFELDVSGGSPPPRIVGLRHPARVDQGHALT